MANRHLRQKRGPTPPPKAHKVTIARMGLAECRPTRPRRVDTPQWEDANGEPHLTEEACLEENIHITITNIVERDFEIEMIREKDSEEYVDFVMRNRVQLGVVLSMNTADLDLKFRDFMANKFGRDWNLDTSDESRAIRDGLREAFTAGSVT